MVSWLGQGGCESFQIGALEGGHEFLLMGRGNGRDEWEPPDPKGGGGFGEN